jgi:hypothetical protein
MLSWFFLCEIIFLLIVYIVSEPVKLFDQIILYQLLHNISISTTPNIFFLH